jgi:hypothetical protein
MERIKETGVDSPRPLNSARRSSIRWEGTKRAPNILDPHGTSRIILV